MRESTVNLKVVCPRITISYTSKSNVGCHKQAPRGYIRCDFIVTHCILNYDDFLPSKTAIFVFKINTGQTDEYDLAQRCVVASNKAGYTAQDAPSMHSFHLQK